MIVNSKIYDFPNFKTLDKDTQLGLCFGHFNALHPGHFRYLTAARELCDHLAVFVQGKHEVEEDQRFHYFSSADRALGLANVQCVDSVITPNGSNLGDAVQLLKPSFLILGNEYQESQSQSVKDAIEALKSYGGKLIFHAGDAHYASSLLSGDGADDESNRRMNQYNEALRRAEVSNDRLIQLPKSFDTASLLVIGDTIVDQYVACDALGMSAEAPVIVVRELNSEEYVGGAGIVAAHIQALGGQCHFLSVVGADSNADTVRDGLDKAGVSHDLFVDQSRPTTFKIRYVVEQQKMFRVSRLRDHVLTKEIEERLLERIEQLAPTLNGIVVSDFVYGVITPAVIAKVKEVAKKHNFLVFGDLQCSSQIGNILKFEGIDMLFPTEREARISLNAKDGGVEWVANEVMRQTGAKKLMMKLGSDGFIAYDTTGDGFVSRQHFPALCANPVDVTGAGDSLLAATALSLSAGSDIMEAAAIGACVASLAVSRFGNTPISNEMLGRELQKILG